MKILIDMNLTPQWCPVFEQQGWQPVHWSTVGDPAATDEAIMRWAAEHDAVVFTHDLDFGAILASTQAEKPSVVQVRTRDVLPDRIGTLVVVAFRQFQALLTEGALVVIDEPTSRARILPLRHSEEG